MVEIAAVRGGKSTATKAIPEICSPKFTIPS